MRTLKLIVPSAIIAILLITTACTTPDATAEAKGYTLKTVKSSPAPRDKFYKIIKVPIQPKPAPNCAKQESTTDQSGPKPECKTS